MRPFLFLAAAACALTLAAPAGHAQSSFPPAPPVKVAVNPVTDKVYLANTDANTVTAYDAAAGTSTTIAVGAAPSFVAVNPATNRVYVDNLDDATLSVIDGSSDTLIDTYAIGSAGPIAIDPVANIVYIVRLTGTGSDEVTYFNGATSTWYTVATNSFQPIAVGVNPAAQTIYVAHYGTGDLRVISGAFNPADDFPASVSIGMFSHPFAVAVNPVANKVYVVTQDARGPIAVVDGTDNSAVFPAVAAGHGSGPQSLVVDPVANKAYAAFANEVIAIDGATNALTYIPIDGAGSGAIALGIDYSTHRVYAATALGSLSVIDTDSDTVLATETIPAGTSAIGVNMLTGMQFLFDTSLATRVDSGGETAHAIPLTVSIQALPGDASGTSGSISMNAASTFSPTALPVRAVYWRLDTQAGSWATASGSGPYTASFSGLAAGSHTLYAFAADGEDAPFATGPQSNPLVGQVAAYTFTVVVPRATPSVSLASSANPSAFAQAVTFTASVAGSAGTPTGTVTFRDGTATLCAAVALADGTAQCATSSLASGTHSITAEYPGDASYDGATSSAVSQAVGAAPVDPSVALASSVNPSTPGEDVTFTVTVSGTAGMPTGSVNFTDGSTSLAGCSAVALTSGTATCSSSALALGSHAISAAYSGDAAYNAGTSSVVTQNVQSNPTLTVSKAGSGMGTVTSSPSGISCGATCSADFASGTVVSLSAAADSGSSFVGWSGGGCSGVGSCSVTLDAATTVTATFASASDQPRLGALSTRMDVLTGDNVMIGGFVIQGSTAKTVIIRARGPSLSGSGIANPLADPVLQLVFPDGTVVANDNWGDAPNAAQIQASGMQPGDPRESAILVTLDPGAYTAIVSGAGGSTGVGIVEVFEVDHPENPLAGISTRGFVQSGDDVLIGGIVIQGNAPQTVMVRARGPSLASQGVANPLQDPVLQLVASDGTTITNDDWGSAPNAAQVQASGFAPSDPRESAILVTLQPGAYTAIVSGAGGSTGVGIVEVFPAQ
jgi:DNA-binding beta-propeller fold protein YncE